MTEQTQIFVRAHTEVINRPKRPRGSKAGAGSKAMSARRKQVWEPAWPYHALVIDCETTTDERQTLTFGSYRFCRATGDGLYVCVEEGLFYDDQLQESDPEGLSVLQCYVESIKAETPKGYPDRPLLLSRSEFMDRVFWRAAGLAGALVVGFNLPFDLSRLAVEQRAARGHDRGWSLIMFQDTDPTTGQPRHDPFRPRIKVAPKDSKTAFIRFAGVSMRSKKTKKRLVAYTPGRFLDLRTLGWTLRNESYSLQSACKAFGVPGKLDHKPTGQVSVEEIDYCRQDLRATVGLLNAMRADFDKHPIDLRPDRAYSPASIAKDYLRVMGLVAPSQKFKLPGWVLGAAMQAYYGGRAECRIRQTEVPIVHTDFMSEYPTVNTLMALWPFLIAADLKIEDATEEVRDLLAGVTRDVAFNPELWNKLLFFALVRPHGDILPVRTKYNEDTTNIGVNPLTSQQAVWYAGPDVVAAKLLTGRPVEIVRAFKLVPEGQQPDLREVALRGTVRIDPRQDDFFKKVIEERARVKADKTLPDTERAALSYFLKILANAGSYGLFVEVNPERLGADEKTGKPARAKLRVLSGEKDFEQTSPIIESPGTWYCPPIAALITAGGRLLLALLECTVANAGGTYLFCDTDSMAIVASKDGGLLGGNHCLPGERGTIRALSWGQVEHIVESFKQLNPYDRNAVPGSVLKIEDVNFHNGSQRELRGYGIAAKRYALFTRTADGGVQIEKASAHGLGFLYPPKPGFDSHVGAPIWVVEGWDWTLRVALGLAHQEPFWFQLPGMMRFTITTPEVLKVLQVHQTGLAYRDRVKPFNFILSPIIDHHAGHPVGVDANHFTLITPFNSDPSLWYGLSYINVHDGNLYQLARPGRRLSYQAEAKTYGDIVSQYRWHPEAKSLAPDATPCTSQTKGLLRRTPVIADGLRYIGKETNRRWEQGEDISMLEQDLLEYRPGETAGLITDLDLQRHTRWISIRALARMAGVSEKTVKAARSGLRLRRSTMEKLRKAISTANLSG
jgi:hypothetical protein